MPTATSATAWFAYPLLLGLLAVLPALALLTVRAARRRAEALSRFGQAYAVLKLRLGRPQQQRRRLLLTFAGLAFLVLGAAGPQWGRSPEAVASAGRDLVLVLDVSRSMYAEQPSRLERGLRALRHLAGELAERGGPRVALVVFAAHPVIHFPLTSDYDHFEHALTRIGKNDLPTALAPQPGDVSGTRIGAALRLALAAADRSAATDILLISDGDDPVRDEEYLEGAEHARQLKVPVHVLAVGDPARTSTIPERTGPLLYQGKPVASRPDEALLQDIARRTSGVFIPAHTSDLPLGKLLPSVLAQPRPTGSVAPTEEAPGSIPVLQPRYVWFLAPAFVLLALSVSLTERRRPVVFRWWRPGSTARLASALLLLAFVGAASPPENERRLRQGVEALERGDFQQALGYFQQAEALAADPGLVAFNKAAALYHLGDYGEAALHYERCLEDELIPASRRARAWFQLANARLKQSNGDRRELLEKALEAYRACLELDDLDPGLKSDARFNLELARLLWLKTQPSSDPGPKDGSTPDPAKKQDGSTKEAPNQGDPTKSDGGADSKTRPKGDLGAEAKTKSKRAAVGPLTVLPDDAQLVPLSPAQVEAHLQALAERILNERRLHYQSAAETPDNLKNW